ncbi:hypothetical protein M569_06734, partial [Genlisea aurea]
QRKRWGDCWGGLSFFHKQKGGKRIVPSAARIPETNHHHHHHPLSNAHIPPPNHHQNGIAFTILAPPSSPASFSNSALPSTAQSPTSYLSVNSPERPPNTMFVTGPYAHETQLVSPPVFSTFTTEPSTAPLTPPPELAHLTTPSSPDVPYARFLLSSIKTGDHLHGSYSPYPESPSSTLRSPATAGTTTTGKCLSSSSGEREFTARWDAGGMSKPRQDSNFFCPETFAQFYDQSCFSNSGGRLSISKESDCYSYQGSNKQSKSCCKPDAEELEAYRASFGFSADEMLNAASHYVEVSEISDDSFTIKGKKHDLIPSAAEGEEWSFYFSAFSTSANNFFFWSDMALEKQYGYIGRIISSSKHGFSDDEDIFSRLEGRKHTYGLSNSDAEIEYRRGRSLRERNGRVS